MTIIILLLLKKEKNKVSETFGLVADKVGMNKLEKQGKELLHQKKNNIFFKCKIPKTLTPQSIK